MTQAEANKMRTDLNNALAVAGADIYVKYDTFAYWEAQMKKIYNVCLFPKAHEAKFETGTESQRIAFQRVSIITQVLGSSSYEAFVNNFNAEAAQDAELDAYLKS